MTNRSAAEAALNNISRSSSVRCSRTEMRRQVGVFLDSMEVDRWNAEDVFQALVACFGPVRLFSVDYHDEFWLIIRRFDSRRA